MADPITEQMILEAVKQRLLREIQKEPQASPQVINNLGLPSAMGNAPAPNLYEALADPSNLDYFVDIERQDTPTGWTKKVHRYSQPKGAPIKKKRKT